MGQLDRAKWAWVHVVFSSTRQPLEIGGREALLGRIRRRQLLDGWMGCVALYPSTLAVVWDALRMGCTEKEMGEVRNQNTFLALEVERSKQPRRGWFPVEHEQSEASENGRSLFSFHLPTTEHCCCGACAGDPEH